MIDGTVVINYLVDENRDYAQVLEERDGNGNLLVRYVYGHDLISQTRGGATTYYHYDGSGSTRALTNGSEGITDTYTYDAFGNLLDKTGSTTNTHLYTGEFFDSNTGFYYLRARYMNPAVGRFVTMDTFAGRNRDPYSLHKYLYAHANPVNLVDPSGQSPTVAELAFVGSVLGAGAGWRAYQLTHPGDEWSFRECFIWTGWGAFTGGMFVLWAVPTVATVIPAAAEMTTSETVELYRAVGVREYESIMTNNAFLPGANSLEGRQFAMTFNEALRYSNTDLSKVSIIMTRIPKWVFQQLDFSRTIDPTIFVNGVVTVQPEQLEQFNSSLLTIEQVL